MSHHKDFKPVFISSVILFLFLIILTLVLINSHVKKTPEENIYGKIDCNFDGWVGKCVKREMCNEPAYQIMERDDSKNECEIAERDVICCPLDILETGNNKKSRESPRIKESDPTSTDFKVGLRSRTFEDKKDEDDKKSILNGKSCGTQRLGDRAFGGEKAAPGEFKFFASLMYEVNGTKKALCGGSLISNFSILTAAHCIKKSLVGVRIGGIDLTKERDNDKAPKAVIYEIERTIKHENYSKIDGNDIALIVLKEQVKLGGYVRPVCLPLEDNDRLEPSKELTFQVMGFGRTEHGNTSNVLLKVGVPFVPNDECKNFYQNLSIIFNDGIMCAGSKGKDSCNGDSGSPLVTYKTNKTKLYQYGIVSKGVKCAVFPGIYTKVEAYIDWILENVE